MGNPMNVLIFVPHDLGQHLGCYGVPTVHSPSIDALAREAVSYTHLTLPTIYSV